MPGRVGHIPRRNTSCTACGQKHKKPVNEQCPYVSVDDAVDVEGNLHPGQRHRDDMSEASEASSFTRDLGQKLLEKFDTMQAQIAGLNAKVDQNAQNLAERDQSHVTQPALVNVRTHIA